VAPSTKVSPSLLTVDNPHVIVGALKVCDDGKGLAARLFSASESAEVARLTWYKTRPSWFSLPDECKGPRLQKGEVVLPAKEMMTIRAAKRW